LGHLDRSFWFGHSIAQRNWQTANERVDPFSGSGTTLIAAEMTGRSCLAIDIDPAYVDVAVLRWQAFTGQDARLEGADRSFADVVAERRGSGAA